MAEDQVEPDDPDQHDPDQPGEVVLEDVVLHFADGIPGFPEVRQFALVEEVPDSAFQLLQCIEEPGIAIIVTVPWLFFPEYAPEISDLEASELGLEAPEDAVVFNPVTLDAENDLVYVNLLGPFVVNSRTREGRQLVLTDSDHPTRAPLDLSEL